VADQSTDDKTGKTDGKTSGKTDNKKKSGAQTGKTGQLSDYTIDMKKKAQNKLNSLFDLVNTQVTVPPTDPKGQPVVYQSPLNDPAKLKDLLPKLFLMATTSADTEIPARIN